MVHPVYMAQTARKLSAKVTPRPKKQYRPTFIRAWRKFRNLTQHQLADRIGKAHSSVGRIERGLQPYSQELLEALADALQTEPASLLMRDPTEPDAIWSIWDQAKPGQRRAIVEHAKIIVRTGTDD